MYGIVKLLYFAPEINVTLSATLELKKKEKECEKEA